MGGADGTKLTFVGTSRFTERVHTLSTTRQYEPARGRGVGEPEMQREREAERPRSHPTPAAVRALPQGSAISALRTGWAGEFFVVQGTMLSNFPDLYQLDASGTPPRSLAVCPPSTNKTTKRPLMGKTHPWLRSTDLNK